MTTQCINRLTKGRRWDWGSVTINKTVSSEISSCHRAVSLQCACYLLLFTLSVIHSYCYLWETNCPVDNLNCSLQHISKYFCSFCFVVKYKRSVDCWLQATIIIHSNEAESAACSILFWKYSKSCSSSLVSYTVWLKSAVTVSQVEESNFQAVAEKQF